MPVGAFGKQSACSTGGSQSVRSSDDAGTDRGAKGTQEGGSMTNRTTETKPQRVPARASPQRKQPGAIDLVGTENLSGMLGDEAKSRSLLQEYPLTGKPDAGDPPVRFGGRGGGHPLSLPLSQCTMFSFRSSRVDPQGQGNGRQGRNHPIPWAVEG